MSRWVLTPSTFRGNPTARGAAEEVDDVESREPLTFANGGVTVRLANKGVENVAVRRRDEAARRRKPEAVGRGRCNGGSRAPGSRAARAGLAAMIYLADYVDPQRLSQQSTNIWILVVLGGLDLRRQRVGSARSGCRRGPEPHELVVRAAADWQQLPFAPLASTAPRVGRRVRFQASTRG